MTSECAFCGKKLTAEQKGNGRITCSTACQKKNMQWHNKKNSVVRKKEYKRTGFTLNNPSYDNGIYSRHGKLVQITAEA